jgi:hypothetical protein
LTSKQLRQHSSSSNRTIGFDRLEARGPLQLGDPGGGDGTRIADAAQLYLRYDGEIGAVAANHTLNLGVRFSR